MSVAQTRPDAPQTSGAQQHLPALSAALGTDRRSLEKPNPCELHCDLFQQLPTIRKIAACNDPMIRSLPRILEGAIRDRVPTQRRAKSPMWRNRRRLIGFLTRLFGG